MGFLSNEGLERLWNKILLKIEGMATETYVNEKIAMAPTLPTVTDADNGKVLMVVNGEWQVVSLNLSVDDNGTLSV